MAIVDVGIELGGTKVIVGASADGRNLLVRTRLPTTEPAATFAAIRDAVDDIGAKHQIAAVGIGSFGPLDLRHGHASRGLVVRSPKAAWIGSNIVKGIALPLGMAWAIDTDVNAALRAERVYGAATGTAAYLTVGTGVGGGVWIGDGPVMGANHPEIGHLFVPRLDGDDFAGICPYHGDCLEGMASGPALEHRFGVPADRLKGADVAAARDVAAFYVAGGIVGLCSVVPVECVVIGGGVSHMEGFHAAVIAAVPGIADGYPPVPFAEGGPAVVAPALGDDAGVIGSVLLAIRARTASEAS